MVVECLKDGILDFLYYFVKVRLPHSANLSYYVTFYVTYKQLAFCITLFCHWLGKHTVDSG